MTITDAQCAIRQCQRRVSILMKEYEAKIKWHEQKIKFHRQVIVDSLVMMGDLQNDFEIIHYNRKGKDAKTSTSPKKEVFDINVAEAWCDEVKAIIPRRIYIDKFGLWRMCDKCISEGKEEPGEELKLSEEERTELKESIDQMIGVWKKIRPDSHRCVLSPITPKKEEEELSRT